MAMIDDLNTAKQQLLDRIIEITAEPKPNYSIDGQNISWASYLQTLLDGINKLDIEINALEPFEIQSTGYN